jgi:hypothetical protein
MLCLLSFRKRFEERLASYSAFWTRLQSACQKYIAERDRRVPRARQLAQELENAAVRQNGIFIFLAQRNFLNFVCLFFWF